MDAFVTISPFLAFVSLASEKMRENDISWQWKVAVGETLEEKCMCVCVFQ